MSKPEILPAIFARNWGKYLESASKRPPQKPTTFRSGKLWGKPREWLNEFDEIPIYFAVIDEGNSIQFKASLRRVLLQPREHKSEARKLLKFELRNTESEGLWNGRVKTLYVISGCRKLKSRVPMTRLKKLIDGKTISPDFNRAYALVQAPGISSAQHVVVDLAEPPPRVEARISRIVRNTTTVRQLKRIHDNHCQRCGKRLMLADKSGYSEGHHLKPLGGKHRGLDTPGNILILCPNCHALFDLCAIKADPKRIRRHPDHVLNQSSVEYHNKMFRMGLSS